MSRNNAYGFGVKTDLPYEQAVERTKAALKAEGFGVLSEIDVKATMKQKLDVDFEKYVILGACNPQLAHQALTEEHELGLLLPCNVVVHEHDGRSVVSAADPEVMLGVVENPALSDIAHEAKERLRHALESLEQ